MRERKRNTAWSGNVGTLFFLLLMIGQSLVGVNPASEKMEGMRGDRKMKEISWVEVNQRTCRQERKCRSGMQKYQKCKLYVREKVQRYL